jgi:hypothetical protein
MNITYRSFRSVYYCAGAHKGNLQAQQVMLRRKILGGD